MVLECLSQECVCRWEMWLMTSRKLGPHGESYIHHALRLSFVWMSDCLDLELMVVGVPAKVGALDSLSGQVEGT